MDRVSVAVSSSQAAAQQFMAAANVFVAALEDLAAALQREAPGTSALLREYAQRESGAALDALCRWP